MSSIFDLPRLLLVLFLVSSAAAVCLDARGIFCVDWSTSAGIVSFNATCLPYAGSAVTWCGFAVSTSPVVTMFPADATIIVAAVRASGNTDVWVEDRANKAFALPACFGTQVSKMSPAGGSVDSTGVLRAAWSRPATLSAPLLQAGYVNLQGNMYMIAAGASDVNNATLTQCSNSSLPVHKYVQSRVAVQF